MPLTLTPTTPGTLNLTAPYGLTSVGVYNVVDYGAKTDGLTDATTAIQSAITAASSAGGVVFFPPGTYLTGKLTVNSSNVTLLGTGVASKLKYATGTSSNQIIRVNTSGDSTGATRISEFRIANLYIDMTNATADDASFAAALGVFAVDGVMISGVTVYNSYDTAIDCELCSSVWIGQRTTVDTVRVGASVGNGINVRGSTSATNSRAWGTSIIDGVITKNVPTIGIHCLGTDSTSISVVNCQVTGDPNSAVSTGSYGIVFESGAVPSLDLTVTGNVVRNCNGVGIGLVNTSNQAVPWGRQAVFSGNVVENCDIGAELTDLDVSIVGNQFVNCRAGVIAGVALAYAEEQMQFAHNLIVLRPGSNSNGITISKAAAGTLSKVIVEGNSVSGDQAPPPLVSALRADSTAAQVDAGTHVYAVSFVTVTGETIISGTNPAVTNDASHTSVSLTNIPLGPIGVTSRKIYRSTAGTTTMKLLTTIADNTTTTYTDTTPDASLGASPVTRSASASSDGIAINGNLSDIEIRNNIVQHMGLNGINVGASGGQVPSEVVLEGNRIIDCGYRASGGNQNGVLVTTTANRLAIRRNRIYDSGGGTMAVGIWITSSPTLVDIDGNVLSGFPAAQYMIFDASPTGRLQARDTYALTDAAGVSSDPTRADFFTWSLTANAARTLNAPVSPKTMVGTRITYLITNNSGVTFTGPITFNAVFLTTAAFGATIANLKSRMIGFVWSGASWVEEFRRDTDF